MDVCGRAVFAFQFTFGFVFCAFLIYVAIVKLIDPRDGVSAELAEWMDWGTLLAIFGMSLLVLCFTVVIYQAWLKAGRHPVTPQDPANIPPT